MPSSVAIASNRPGLGSMPYPASASNPAGTTFRVWAPFAPWVHVIGSFNGWNVSATPLARERSGGYWSADVDGVKVGDTYRYVLGDAQHTRVDPRALDVTHSAGNGIVWQSTYKWQTQHFRMPAWNELVIYELHPSTFPKHPRPGGQILAGIARDLTDLRDLGINAIELMPLKEFPGDNSWGYNPVHLFAIEESYGGPDSLKQLVDTAHSLGIAVILDVVYQHFSIDETQHSVWQFDGWHQVYESQPMGGIYFYNDWRARTDVGSRPDYGRPEVRQFIRDNVMMWLEEYRIDGLRLDKVAGIRNAHSRDDVPWDDASNLNGWGWNLLRWINDEVNYHQPWKIMIAEDMRQNANITAPTSTGGAGFDSQWDDQYYKTIRAALETPDDRERNLYDVRDAITRRWNGDAFHRVIYTESHDEVGSYDGRPNGKSRLTEAISPGQADSHFAKKRSTLGAAIVMTSPGIPMIFQGQEMLEWALFDGKQDLDWSKATRYSGIVLLYRDLIRLRRNWYNQTRGLQGHETNVFHVNQDTGILAMHRYDRGGAGDDTIVVLNFHNQAYTDYRIGFPREGMWRVRFNSDWSGYSPDFQNHLSHDTFAHRGRYDNLGYNGTIGIGGYTAIVLSQ